MAAVKMLNESFGNEKLTNENIDEIEIDNIEDVRQLKKLYSIFQQRERDLDDELDSILDHHSEIEQELSRIHETLPELTLVKGNADNLSTTILNASILAEKVSSKVRLLDVAKSRVQDTIKRVDDILDLKSCVEGVRTALVKEEYEQAAAFIHRYLSLDERALREILPVDAEGTDLNVSFQYLHNAQKELQNIISKKFTNAANEKSHTEVERYFKLFPLLGVQDVGLKEFSLYLCSLIRESGSANLERALAIEHNDRRANIVFADTITLLFEGIARMIENQQPLVDTYYAPGQMSIVLAELQTECDRQFSSMLDACYETRNIDKTIENLSKPIKAVKVSSSVETTPPVDPRDLDAILGEIALISSRTELYLNFMTQILVADQNLSESAAEGSVLNILSNSKVCQSLQLLCGKYIQLEEYFIREMIDKAVALDITDDDSLTSSMVDDIFFIVQKSLRRTLSSSNADVICAMLNNTSSLLIEKYKEVLRKRIKDNTPSNTLDLTGMLQGKLQLGSNTATVDAATSRKILMTALNNTDVSTTNLQMLRDDIKAECEQFLKNRPEKDRGKVDSCLSEMTSCFQAFKELLQSGISQLCTMIIFPKLQPAIDSFTNNTHSMSEEEFSFYEADDPFVKAFVAALENSVISLKELLTPSNYEAMISLTCNETAAQLEKVVLKSKFNRLGGLQFDKELRSLIGYLTNITEWTVRDKFTRLTQIATILNLEKVSEIMDYWEPDSGSMTWRLTPAEVRQILSLRSDFKNEEIQRLKL